MQNSLMKFDPATGEENPYPSNAEQYRSYHDQVAWLFNPWSGDARSAQDIGSDVFGKLIEDGSIDGYGIPTEKQITQADVVEYLKKRTGWSEDWIKSGFNGCFIQAAKALYYLSRNPRPSGGEDFYNGMHLDEISKELQMTQKAFFGENK